VSWVVPLLPNIERADLYRNWRQGMFLTSAQGNSSYNTLTDPTQNGFINLLVCPSDPPASTYPAPTAYVVNAGQIDVLSGSGYPCDPRANGVFFNRFQDNNTLNASLSTPTPSMNNVSGAPIVTMTQDYISANDGTSNTLALSENANQFNDQGNSSTYATLTGALEFYTGFVWHIASTASAPYQPADPNATFPVAFPFGMLNYVAPSNATQPTNGYQYARPSSRHPQGVNVLFCDGHSRFLAQELDYGIYCLIMTPDGQNCNTPGNVSLVAPSGSNNYLYLRTAPLKDDALN
jgi:prepilin-type processing-associated H-X9-DG protein